MSKKKPAKPELFMLEQLEDSKRIIRQAGMALSDAAEKLWPSIEIQPLVNQIKGQQ